MNIHQLDVGDVRKARRNWKSKDYDERISELGNPTTWKWKFIRFYCRVSPFTSVQEQIDIMHKKSVLQDMIVERLDNLEHEVGEFQSLLDDWREVSYY